MLNKSNAQKSVEQISQYYNTKIFQFIVSLNRSSGKLLVTTSIAYIYIYIYRERERERESDWGRGRNSPNISSPEDR